MEGSISMKQLRELYLPPTDDFVRIDVPPMRFFMIDGAGDAIERAVQWIWAVVYPVRGEAKKRMGRNFVEPPLEALWWADDMADLAAGRKDRLKWRMLVSAPDWVDDDMLAAGIAHAEERLGPSPAAPRIDGLHEGPSVQIMYVGHPSTQGPTMARLHERYLPEHGLEPNGPHHEIYLNDPRRTAPEKLRTVLRQPVRPCA